MLVEVLCCCSWIHFAHTYDQPLEHRVWLTVLSPATLQWPTLCFLFDFKAEHVHLLAILARQHASGCSEARPPFRNCWSHCLPTSDIWWYLRELFSKTGPFVIRLVTSVSSLHLQPARGWEARQVWQVLRTQKTRYRTIAPPMMASFWEQTKLLRLADNAWSFNIILSPYFFR